MLASISHSVFVCAIASLASLILYLGGTNYSLLRGNGGAVRCACQFFSVDGPSSISHAMPHPIPTAHPLLLLVLLLPYSTCMIPGVGRPGDFFWASTQALSRPAWAGDLAL